MDSPAPTAATTTLDREEARTVNGGMLQAAPRCDCWWCRISIIIDP